MALVVGLKESFLKGSSEILEKAREMYSKGRSWEEVESYIRELYKEDLSFRKLNLFSYLFLVGGSLLLPALILWKLVFPSGSIAHFLSKLLFILCAMFTLKGIVGHYVVVFINRDRFDAELRALKATLEGGKDGEQPN
jgi:hypothetical protein